MKPLVKKSGVDTRRITMLSLLVCVALVVSLIESMLPSLIPLAPGAKLGLSNITPLLALVIFGIADAFTVMLIKCFLSALITGGLSGLMYSLPAGLVSLAIEVVLFVFVFDRMSLAGVSLVGAVAFNCVQLLMASIITGVDLISLLPWLMTAGALAGSFTGLLTYYTVKKLPFFMLGANKRK